MDLLVKWQGCEEMPRDPMEVMNVDDPVALEKYAEEQGLLNQSKWQWAKKICQE